MKISTQTLDILKNFSTINNSILVKKGQKLQTVSPTKNIMAEANIEDTFPMEFGIYDLSRFLGVVSMYKTEPEIEFNTNELIIKDSGTKSELIYRYTAKSLIVSPPDKGPTLPTEDAAFDLSSENLSFIQKAASVLQSPQIMIEGKNGKIYMVAIDLQNNAADVMRIEVGETNQEFNAILRTENLKLVPKSYKVTLSLKGISKFTSTDDKVVYWVATEAK